MNGYNNGFGDGFVLGLAGGGGSGGGGLSDEFIVALQQILRKAMYSADMSQNITNLAEYAGTGGGSGDNPGDEPGGGETEKTLTSITAVANTSVYEPGTAYSALDITVTAHYSDGTTQTVVGWTATGTVQAGANTVTVSYGGKTAQVTVMGVNDAECEYCDWITQKSTEYGRAARINVEGIYGIRWDKTYSIETSFRYDDSTFNKGVPILGVKGAESGNTVKMFALFALPKTGQLGYWWQGADTDVTTITDLVSGQKNTVSCVPAVGGGVTITVNGASYSCANTGVDDTLVAQNMFGFIGYRQAGNLSFGVAEIILKLGETVFRDSSNNVVYDFKPAYSNTEECYGLHETVNNIFYKAENPDALTGGNNW